LNGSGRSPLGLSYDQMKSELAKLHRETIPPLGMLPISVPGVVDAWAELHKKFGKLKLSDDLAPAVRYAEEGFPVTELIAYYWGRSVPLYKNMPGGFLETYTLDGKGRAPAKGDIFKNPALAKSLRLIGEKGRDVFYKGEIADKIDAFMQANGGFLRKADFEKHTSTWVEPVSTNYRGYDVFELPPKRPGHRHAPDVEHSRRIRSARDGLWFGASAARDDRSEENRLGGSRQILRRSRVHENSAHRFAFEELRGGAA
jgi:gamma-glutamyltranspeptidase/glutathione hydrolase